jgi:tetratricopeptide (TPR) repeat protein
MSKKNWEAAGRYAKINKDLNLDGTEGLMAEGRIELAKGNVDRAIDLMRQGLDKYPNFSLGWTYLADAYEKAERTADARDVLLEALKRDPTNGFANRALARIEVAGGNQAESERYLHAAARVLPNDPWVRHQLQLIKEKENPQEGIASREKARRADPKDVNNLLLLARLYGLPKVGQFDKAAEIYREALGYAKDDRELPLAREFASFLGREDVNRPSEGDALLTGLMTQASDKSKKAEIAVHLGIFYEQQKQLATADRHFRLAVSLEPSRAILTSAGEYYSRTNRFRDALEYYERALRDIEEGSVDDRSIRSRMIALTLALGDLDQSRQTIDTFLARFPDSPQGMIYEGAYHRIAGDVEQARKSFDAHLEKNPDNAVALWQRGQLFMLMNQWQNAIDDLSRSKTYNLNGFNYQHRIALAHCFMEVGQREAAVSELRSILEESPDQQAVAEALVDLHIRIGPSRYGDAENLIYTFSRKFPRDHKWPMLLGRVAELQQDADKAIQAYEKAAELSQFRRETVGALFHACQEQKRPQVIIDYASERLSTRLLQTMPSALSAVAWAYAKIGDETKALETYDRATEAAINNFADFNRVVHQMVGTFGLEEALAREQQRAAAEPDNLNRQKVLVHLLFLNHDNEGAYQVCRKIEELAASDADTVFSHLAQGMLLEQMSKYEEARKNYEAALKLIPDDWFALNNLAYLLTDKLNRPAEAIPYAERAKRAAPSNPDVLDTLGWSLFKDGRYGEALGVLLRASSVNREDPMLLYHLALVYQEQGNLDEALNRLESAELIAKDRGHRDLLSKIVERLDEVKRAQ